MGTRKRMRRVEEGTVGVSFAFTRDAYYLSLQSESTAALHAPSIPSSRPSLPFPHSLRSSRARLRLENTPPHARHHPRPAQPCLSSTPHNV
jgi:hypothetical protein